MPDFGELLNYVKEAGQAILTIVLVCWVIYHGAKREVGKAIGGVVILAIFIIIIKNPDQTIIQFAQELIKKLIPGYGG